MYSSASGVAKWNKNILGPDMVFTDSSSPTITAVKDWQSSGCSVIETILSGRGYSMPVAANSRAYNWVVNLEELWAAAHVELSRTNVTFSPEQRSRGQVLSEMFWEELGKLAVLDLSRLGVDRSNAGTIYVGGIKASEKQTIEDNTDLLKPRFFRSLGNFPETVRPTPSTASPTS